MIITSLPRYLDVRVSAAVFVASGFLTALLLTFCGTIDLISQTREPEAVAIDTSSRFVGMYRDAGDSVRVATMLRTAYDLPRIKRDSALAMAKDAVRIVEGAVVDSLHMDLAEAWHWVGRHSLSLGHFSDAERAFRMELSLLDRLVGQDHERRANAFDYIARSLRASGNARDAIPHYRSALAIRRRLNVSRDNIDLAGSMNNLALAYVSRGEYEAADSLYRESLAMKRRLYPGDDVDLATTINNIGLLELERGHVNGAIALLTDGVDMLRRVVKDQDPVLPAGIAALSRALEGAGRYDTARVLADEVLKRRKEVYAGDHPAVAASLTQLGRLLWLNGNRTEGEKLVREALAMNIRLSPAGSQGTAANMVDLSALLRQAGQFEEADTLALRATAMRRELLGPDHAATAAGLIELARVRVKSNSFHGIDSMLTEAARILDANSIGDHPLRVGHLRARAESARAKRHTNESIGAFDSAEKMLVRMFPQGHPDINSVLTDLAAQLDVAGRTDDARATRLRATSER